MNKKPFLSEYGHRNDRIGLIFCCGDEVLKEEPTLRTYRDHIIMWVILFIGERRVQNRVSFGSLLDSRKALPEYHHLQEGIVHNPMHTNGNVPYV